MPKQKNKSNEMAIEPVDNTKPLVKDFFDPEKNLIDFIQVRLPHVPHSTISLRPVYQNTARTVFRYRVNYWLFTGDAVPTPTSIAKSLMIQIQNSATGLVFTDITAA